MKSLVLIISILTVCSVGSAQSAMESKTVRIYPGGIDEDSLEVQDSLPQPYSDVNKSAIVKQVYEELVDKNKDNQ